MRIIIRNLQKKIPIDPKKIKKVVLRVLQIEKTKKPGQINFFFVHDNKIKELNLRYQNKNYTTDVLSFDLSISSEQMLADIVISTDTAVRNTRLFKTSLQYEIYLYVIHGLLHLLGYNDKDKKNRLIMQKRQEFLLKILNLSS